ncbi:methyl-accepting chemotaxis protein [Pantoea sp. SOD02]|uniref:methyl-accepting chemotaxis protein n=1 Tax=Pantoea sp. SOD02 TaxID=2970818 RepID=UPI00215764A4|nr:methyl-accepting chemotaxis protein [Pantoea sp. SOD02]UVC29971.1 methyl-accepting chemotaxis protein [Pantoea sp. SOD02]
MLKKLKIHSAISLIISLFAAILFATVIFSLYDSYSNNVNFKRIVVSSENNARVRDAAYNISAAMANTNGLMLQAARGRAQSADVVKLTHVTLDKARISIDEFMSTPFNSPEESKAGAEVNAAFDAVYKSVLDKIDHVDSPESYAGTLNDEMALRTLLRQKIAQYNDVTSKQSQAYIDEAESNYEYMIYSGVLIVAVALIMMFITRIWLRRTLVQRMKMTVDMLKRVGSGDLSHKVTVGQTNEIGEMLHELEVMRTSLTDTIHGIRESVLHIHSNAQEIAHGNNDLSSRTEEQAAALQQTAASMEQIKTTVRQNADNAHSARQLAEGASNNARHGGEAMLSLEQIMAQITVSSRQIADINGVIDSIANQTNILALNAAVEAARAGEQGRGFAVVAEEVRNLAKRSADAAKEINQLITTCVSNMDTGSRQVNQASTVMQEIVSSVAQVTQIMGEITSASDEQSAGINQISQAVNEMDLVTQQNAAMVEEAAIAAGELEAQSESLEKRVAQFILGKEVIAGKAPSMAKITASRSDSLSNPKDNEQWETF